MCVTTGMTGIQAMRAYLAGVITEEAYWKVYYGGKDYAPYCDQVRYTKYDPDSTYDEAERVEKMTSGTPEYKSKAKVRRGFGISVRHSVKVTDEELHELIEAFSKLSVVYLKDGKRKDTVRSRRQGVSMLSGETNVFGIGWNFAVTM